MKDLEREVALSYFSMRDYQAFREEFEGYSRQVSATFGQVEDRIRTSDSLFRDF